MLTPNDIANDKRKSGYNYVGVGSSARYPAKKPFQAMKRPDSASTGNRAVGPRRATALEAAQDYCDYINSGAAVHRPPRNRSAGHKRPQRSPQSTPREVQEALGILRDFRAQRRGVQGFVYCVGERVGRNLSPYVKIGYSVNPDKRLIELQTSNPRTLVLLGTIAGTVDDEAALHAKYHKFNVMQEWFGRCPDLMAEFGLTHDGRKAKTS